MRPAVSKVIQDENRLREAAQRKLYVDYKTPSETCTLISSIFSRATPALRASITEVATKKYRQ
jgi:hypothetical protein